METVSYRTALERKLEQYSVAGEDGSASAMCNKGSAVSLRRDRYSCPGG